MCPLEMMIFRLKTRTFFDIPGKNEHGTSWSTGVWSGSILNETEPTLPKIDMEPGNDGFQ